jgi:hypothetical protein
MAVINTYVIYTSLVEMVTKKLSNLDRLITNL